MDIKETETKKKAGRPKAAINFAKIKKYIQGLDMKYSQDRDAIIKQAEKNDAPEEVINLLLKLPNTSYYHYYYEIQNAINKIQQPATLEQSKHIPTEMEIIKDELKAQKEICDDRGYEIKKIKRRLAFRDKICLGIPYTAGCILLILSYIHMGIAIASKSKYNLIDTMTVPNLSKTGAYWVVDDITGPFIMIFIIVISLITILAFIALWCLAYGDE